MEIQVRTPIFKLRKFLPIRQSGNLSFGPRRLHLLLPPVAVEPARAPIAGPAKLECAATYRGAGLRVCEVKQQWTPESHPTKRHGRNSQ
jgi:hypothetical protein